MTQTVAAPKVLGPQDLPKEIREKLKFLQQGENVRLVRKRIRKATEIHTGPGGVNYAVPDKPIESAEGLYKAWQIMHDNMPLTVGFVKGIKMNGELEYIKPTFRFGELRLSGNNVEHQLIYQMMQLYPTFEKSLFPQGAPEFYEYDADAVARSEAKAADEMLEALQLVNNLRPTEVSGLGSVMGLVGTEAQILAQLKTLAAKNPKSVLDYRKDLTAISIRGVVESGFALKIWVPDFEKKQIVDSETGKAVIPFDDKYAMENQEEAVKVNLVAGVLGKDKTAEAAYSKLSRKVQEVIALQSPETKLRFTGEKPGSLVNL